MTKRKIQVSLTALLALALLSAGASPSAATAQRRRPAQTPAPAARPPKAPAPASTPSVNAPRGEAQQAKPQEPRPQEPDRPIEDILAADAYGVYAEVRRVGQSVEGEEMKMALGALRLLGDAADRQMAELASFVSEQSEPLGEATASVGLLPTRAGLPQALVALRMPSAESAAAFEPKLRAFLGGLLKGPVAPSSVVRPKRRAAAKPAPRQRPAAAPGFVLKRSGSLLLAADSAFTLKALRGDGLNPLSQSVRFQSARNRFNSEQLFVYVDTTHAQQGWVVQAQREQEAREAAEASQRRSAEPPEEYDTIPSDEDEQAMLPSSDVPRAVVVATPAPEPSATGTQGTAPAAGAQQTPQPEPQASPAAVGEVADATSELPASKSEEAEGEAPVALKPTEEQLAAGRMSGVLRHLWGGMPRIPGAFAAAVGIESGSVALRVAVDAPPEGATNVIPFLPNVVSGPPVTSETAEIAPANGDIFFNVSLDWTQIFNSVMGTAAASEVMGTSIGVMSSGISVGTRGDVLAESDGPDPDSGEKPPTAEQTVALVEKLFGFKFKEDLLPSLGNEVAVSLPWKLLSDTMRINRQNVSKEEKESEPGFVVLVTLNDPEKVRKILPRVLAALNLVAPGVAAASERREGYEIQSAGSFVYAFVDNFLVLGGEVKAVRNVIDSRTRQETLAYANSYRDSTSWQARQRLVHAYLSDALMRSTITETKRLAGTSTDPLVQAMLTQLEVPPEAASYSTTHEGDVLLHELRLPVGLVKVYAAATVIGNRESPIIGNEMMTLFALSRIRDAEDSYRNSKDRERYGTLEELIAEELLDKTFEELQDYKIELTVSGDKYEVSATPKNYGKTGRRSFFLDDSGVIRGADHKGRPATAEDPPVD